MSGHAPIVAGGLNRYPEALQNDGGGGFGQRYECRFLWVDADEPVQMPPHGPHAGAGAGGGAGILLPRDHASLQRVGDGRVATSAWTRRHQTYPQIPHESSKHFIYMLT
jgi:hypothetical protein